MNPRTIFLATVLGTAAVLADGPAAYAQDVQGSTAEVTQAVAPAAAGARLGVFLRPGCDVGPDVRGACATPLVVAGVVEGSPADEAGVLPGDTLLRLDGVRLQMESGRRALARLQPGHPVELDIGREDHRREVHVVPTAWQPATMFRMNGTAWMPTLHADVQVYRFPDGEGGVSEFHFTPAPGSPPPADAFVIFHEDEHGTLQVEIGHPSLAVKIRNGESVELTELQGHLRALEDGLDELEATALVEGGSLILENAPLARRLESIRIRALSRFRARFDDVVQRRAELARRGELPSGVAAAYAYAVPSRYTEAEAPRAPNEVWETRAGMAPRAATGYRLAGAEFRPLTPGLAEYFPVDSGLLVLRVIEQTPADRVGLRDGDVVTEVGGHKMPDLRLFRQLVAETQAAGVGLEVKWNRKGSELTGTLTTP